MGPPYLNRIPVALPERERGLLEAMAETNGKPLATIARDMLVQALGVAVDPDGTWWRVILTDDLTAAAVRGERVGPGEAPPNTVMRLSPINLDLDVVVRPKRSGARSGRAKPPTSRKGSASRRKKGAR